MRAAVEAGADAVYFGLSAFNARARAANFDVEELPAVMAFLHERGLRGFVTMNVLIFDEELAAAEGLVKSIARSGVDAVIVQDIGLVALIARVAPNLAIHGSTQMSITSPEGAEFARELGCKRVVVGRELSVREIAAVRAGTDAEVEAFVHGALCVSYSGQCFSSEAWGGRSANRGQCAQTCRLPYGLVVDGAVKEMGDVQYLLSPQDLMAVELVPQLIEAGPKP
jgi:collagenase-like PrtC family protease